MITYITWPKAQHDAVAAAYFDEVGEVLVDSREDENIGMTGSHRVTEVQKTALKDELGDSITFSSSPPEGW